MTVLSIVLGYVQVHSNDASNAYRMTLY